MKSPGEGNDNPLQYSCLENSMDRGAWWAIQSMGSQRVGHDLVTEPQQKTSECFLSSLWEHSKMETRKQTLTKNWVCWLLAFGLSRLWKCEKKMSVVCAAPSLVFLKAAQADWDAAPHGQLLTTLYSRQAHGIHGLLHLPTPLLKTQQLWALRVLLRSWLSPQSCLWAFSRGLWKKS